MSWRYTGLSILILVAFLAMKIPPLLSSSPEVQPSWLLPPSYDDPEGRLAMGYKLPLQCADVWSLELLKGISDTLAFEIMAKRFEIARSVRSEGEINALQHAHGIGEKTASKLLPYLDLTERCEVSEKFEVWDDRP
jgi:hypothetical protein